MLGVFQDRWTKPQLRIPMFNGLYELQFIYKLAVSFRTRQEEERKERKSHSQSLPTALKN